MAAVCTPTTFVNCPVSTLPSHKKKNASISVLRHGRIRRRNGGLRVAAKEATMDMAPSKDGMGTEGFDCVVVGGGISGLSTAQALLTKHSSVVKKLVVTEAKERVGGNINTVERDGYLWEEGPNSFQPSDSMLTMVVDSGLKDELVLGDPNAPRFVFWEGKLRPVPSGPRDLLSFDLMSIGGKLRAGLGAIGLRSPPPGREESVEEFVRRNLGDEVFERLIEPFCSGVYAGDPAKLSMKAAFGRVWRLEEKGGSIIGGTIKTIQERKNTPSPPRDPRLPKPKGQTVGSFKKGLTTMPNAIANRLGDKVKLGWKLLAIKKYAGCGYELTYETPDGPISIQTKTVVLTVPSYVASTILRPLSVTAADALSQFYYPPVAAVTVSYPKSAIRNECLIDGELRGFGQLHPRSQGIETLGTLYSSSLFPGRAPPDRVLLLNYIGGATNPDIVTRSEGALVSAIDRDLRKILIREDALAPMTLGVKVWPQAIPQFLIGHLDLLETARSALHEHELEGLFLGGNYVVGVALGRCVEGAYESAEAVSQFLIKSLSM
uniref:Protoporphyrinogen oxidase n=1 Tax=Araucaria cunninghamii TaxID=56994 RepID=A0A0D6QX14_ARACU